MFSLPPPQASIEYIVDRIVKVHLVYLVAMIFLITVLYEISVTL